MPVYTREPHLSKQLRELFEASKYKKSDTEVQALIAAHQVMVDARLKDEYFSDEACMTGVGYSAENIFCYGYERIVVGGHGPYVELTEHVLGEGSGEGLYVPQDAAWRLSSPYIDKVKYIEYRLSGFASIKIYKQLRPVTYADYKVGMYYVDFYKIECG